MTETASTAPSAPLFVRPRDGRIAAGVCAGIAARWNLDVTLVRISAAVLTLLSGVGLAAYVIAWLLTPASDGPAPLSADSPHAEAVQQRGRRLLRRVPMLLLLVLTAAIVIGILHSAWFQVPVGLIVLAALIIAVLGHRIGRWFVGVIAVLMVATVAVAAAFGPSIGSRTLSVTNVDDLRGSYDYGVGSLRLDLSGMQLAGDHTTDIHVGRGDVTVLVPSGAAVHVHARAGVGSVRIADRRVSGVDAEQTRDLGDGTSSDTDRLSLDIEVGAGSVTVR